MTPHVEVVPVTQSEPEPEITDADPSAARATTSSETTSSEPRTGERRSAARDTKPHDFGVSGAWLNGDRSAAFQQALDEMARAGADALEHWTSAIEIEPSDLDTLSIASMLAAANRAETNAQAGDAESTADAASSAATESEPTTTPGADEAAATEVHIVEMALDESGQTAFLIFDTPLALSIVTLMMGGNGDPGPVRPLTPLECGLISDLALALSERFAAELHLGPVRIKGHHSEWSTLRDGTAETLMVFGMHMRHAKADGACRLAVSPLSLQVQMEIIDRRINGRRRSTSTPGAAAAAALQPVIVPVVVGFAAIRVPAMAMATLQPGDLLRTGQSLGRQLVASVGDAPVFTVKAGQRGDRLVAEVLSTPHHDYPARSSPAGTAAGASNPSSSQGAQQ